MDKKKAIWIVLLFCMSIVMQAQVYIVGGGQQNGRRTVGEQLWLNISGRIYGTDEMDPKPYPLPSAPVTKSFCIRSEEHTSELQSPG